MPLWKLPWRCAATSQIRLTHINRLLITCHASGSDGPESFDDDSAAAGADAGAGAAAAVEQCLAIKLDRLRGLNIERIMITITIGVRMTGGGQEANQR